MSEPKIIQLNGSSPYFPLSNRVIYITRGLEAEAEGCGIALAEWLAVVGQMPALTLSERYSGINPHTEELEIWEEPGRARFELEPSVEPNCGPNLDPNLTPGITSGIDPDTKPCREKVFGYMPHQISATLHQKLPRYYLGRRFEKILRELGRYPSLPEWRDYVQNNRYLYLEEHFSEQGQEFYAPGRTRTRAKSGGVIAYRPAAVFTYFGPAPYDQEQPEPAYLRLAQEIAQALRAKVITENFL